MYCRLVVKFAILRAIRYKKNSDEGRVVIRRDLEIVELKTPHWINPSSVVPYPLQMGLKRDPGKKKQKDKLTILSLLRISKLTIILT